MKKWLRLLAFRACWEISDKLFELAERLDDTDGGRKAANPFATPKITINLPNTTTNAASTSVGWTVSSGRTL